MEEVVMKNGLFRFYVVFMFVMLALFSCENREVSQDSKNGETMIHRSPPGDQRHPIEPNGEGKGGKKSHRKFFSRSSNLC
jgi:hypothetical protein